MAKVTQLCYEATGHTAIICDFSPPRSGDPSVLQQADINADFISVAYNPGRAVRVNSAMLAAATAAAAEHRIGQRLETLRDRQLERTSPRFRHNARDELGDFR